MSDSEKTQLALNYLEKVNLSDFKGYFPDELSEGMIQRANVARALAINLAEQTFVSYEIEIRN